MVREASGSKGARGASRASRGHDDATQYVAALGAKL
jgi:hypothetical protein